MTKSIIAAAAFGAAIGLSGAAWADDETQAIPSEESAQGEAATAEAAPAEDAATEEATAEAQSDGEAAADDSAE